MCIPRRGLHHFHLANSWNSNLSMTIKIFITQGHLFKMWPCLKSTSHSRWQKLAAAIYIYSYYTFLTVRLLQSWFACKKGPHLAYAFHRLQPTTCLYSSMPIWNAGSDRLATSGLHYGEMNSTVFIGHDQEATYTDLQNHLNWASQTTDAYNLPPFFCRWGANRYQKETDQRLVSSGFH